MAELGAAAAIGAVLATIFIVTVFWRQPAKAHSSVNDAQRTSEPDPSLSLISTRADIEVPAIFLSHSGKQKPFVEHLYNALESANHTAFFDQHSLPKGSPFPSHIKRAARGCKLGVVVLSDDFLTSKWPMLELEILVLQRGHEASVLPIFYKLRPEDLKSTTNLSKWRRVWKKKAGGDAGKWERAVKALNSFNGEVFVQGTSEAAFIKKMVHRICTCVPNHVPYNLSSTQGHQRLAKEIASQFDGMRSVKARMVGLHGVGGLGKTTLCKIMVNFYNVEYLGRSCLIEFPTDGDDKKIVQECKKALKKLANLSNDNLLNGVDSFDQVVELMRQHVRRYDVFLAIDNVWESSLEAAQRILGVSFSAHSKILLTSRSEQVLKDLLIVRGHENNTSVGPLPTPEFEEACQIFQEAFKVGDLNSLVNRNQIDSVLERCRFSGNYHALALKALGQYVKSVCALGDLGKIEHLLSLILEEISNADLENLEDLIRLNYENLPEYKKHMFLDIAVLLRQAIPLSHIRDVGTYAMAHQWLSCVYKEFPKTKITRLIYELALDGLIQIEEDGFSEKMIRVHDLFLDLAQREAASSPRFFTKGSNRLVEEIEWERLERVILRGDENPHFIEKLQQQECRKLRVFCAIDVELRSKIHLDFMPSLCVLILDSVTVVSNEKWNDATSGVAIVEQPLEPIPSMPSLEELTLKNSRAGLTAVEGLDASRVLNLNGLVQLQMLLVGRCSFVKRIAGLDALKNLRRLHVKECPLLENLDGLSGSIRLEALDVERCGSLKKMPDLSGLTCLERMELSWNRSMEEVGCLSSALKDVCVQHCVALKKMRDVSGLTCLERLVLFNNRSMEEVGGEYLSSSLKHLDINRCQSLRSFPSFDDCIHMQTLTAHLKVESALEKLTNLQTLRLLSYDGEWLCSEHHWKRLILLQRLSIEECGSIKIIDVGCLTNLKRLDVGACWALEEIVNLSALHSLEELRVNECPRLKKLGGFMGIATHLKRLFLHNCKLLEATSLPDVSLINSVYISRCGEHNDFPNPENM